MTQNRGSQKSSLKRLLLAVPLLLVIAVLANWGAIRELATGEKSMRAVLHGRPDEAAWVVAGWKMPANLGGADAKVTVEAFLAEGDACHIGSAFRGQALGSIAPDRVKVKFVNVRGNPEGAARRDEVKLGCEQGLAINGETKFVVPETDPTSTKKEKTIYLTHDAGHTPHDLHAILDNELRKAYDGAGLAMTPLEFEEKLAAETKRLQEEAVAAQAAKADEAP